MIGVEIGNWHYAKSGFAWDLPVPSTAPFQLEALGWLKTILRVVIGVLMVNDDFWEFYIQRRSNTIVRYSRGERS